MNDFNPTHWIVAFIGISTIWYIGRVTSKYGSKCPIHSSIRTVKKNGIYICEVCEFSNELNELLPSENIGKFSAYNTIKGNWLEKEEK